MYQYKNHGKQIARDVRRNLLLERAYDLFTYTVLIAMALGFGIVVVELVI